MVSDMNWLLDEADHGQAHLRLGRKRRERTQQTAVHERSV
jgi:hypothetical protein